MPARSPRAQEAVTLRLRILIIDDDQDTRAVLRDLLSTDGYSIAVAEHGREGLRLARRFRPDLILLDVEMPSMTGGEFRQAQLEDRALSDIPVLVVSGVDPDRLRTLNLGDLTFIPKPVSSDVLVRTARRLIARSASRRRSLATAREPPER